MRCMRVAQNQALSHKTVISVFDKTFDTSFKPFICVIFLKHVQITLHDNTLCT